MRDDQKVYTSYDFETSNYENCTRVEVSLYLKEGVDTWRAMRTLLAFGARFEKQVKLDNILTYMCLKEHPKAESGLCACLRVITAIELSHLDHKKMVEEALHSMYLWMENPEKYS